MKKAILLTIIAVFCLIPLTVSAELKGAQYDIAKKNASGGERPVVIKDPDENKAVGYIIYADLNDDGEKDMVIAYKIRKDDKAAEEAVSPYKQVVSVDVIVAGKKHTGFITQELAYVYNPTPYVTVKKGKVFLMMFDGIDNKEGPDTLYTVQCRGFNDDKTSKYQTVKMPWELLLYDFSDALTFVEFESKTKESRGVYFIRPVPDNAAWPKIPVKKIEEFGEKVSERKAQIFWEYGPSTTWGKE